MCTRAARPLSAISHLGRVHRKNAGQPHDISVSEGAALPAAKIRGFHRKVAETPARLRTRRGEPQQYRNAPDTQDKQRGRRATANKILTTLKAALNKAYGDDKILSDAAWRKVRPFKGVDAARVRYLKDDEAARLVNACELEFRPMIQAALLTGGRYGELCCATVNDLDLDAKTLFIVASKSERSRHVVLSDEALEFFAQAAAGKAGDALLFSRSDGKPWGRSHQRRRLLEACKAARINPAVSFHILRHTHATRLAQRGVPLGVIAHQLGHSDTRMAEKHYARLSPSYIADTIRENFPAFGIVPENNVAALLRQRVGMDQADTRARACAYPAMLPSLSARDSQAAIEKASCWSPVRPSRAKLG